MNSITMKCNKCEETKLVSEFQIRKTNIDGTKVYRNPCKKCTNIYKKQKKANNINKKIEVINKKETQKKYTYIPMVNKLSDSDINILKEIINDYKNNKLNIELEQKILNGVPQNIPNLLQNIPNNPSQFDESTIVLIKKILNIFILTEEFKISKENAHKTTINIDKEINEKLKKYFEKVQNKDMNTTLLINNILKKFLDLHYI